MICKIRKNHVRVFVFVFFVLLFTNTTFADGVSDDENKDLFDMSLTELMALEADVPVPRTADRPIAASAGCRAGGNAGHLLTGPPPRSQHPLSWSRLMNPSLIAALADQHIRAVRNQAARRHSTSPRPAPQPGSRPLHHARLRRQIGITLVEAGLRLLATAPAVPGK